MLSLQRWELSWLAAGWAMGVIVQERQNKAPTFRWKRSLNIINRLCSDNSHISDMLMLHITCFVRPTNIFV